MRSILILLKRELQSYFHTPIAYVFLVIFLLLNGIATFYIGDFFGKGQANLIQFFSFHPWLYMIFAPAITMRTWAEERKTGTIELLFTLPITIFEAVISKFLATWLFLIIALFLTVPIWLTVNYLGSPDNGIILASYTGSIMMAGAFLAIGCCVSAFTKNQVVAFVITLIICLLFNVSGYSVLLDSWSNLLPSMLVNTLINFSFLLNFAAITKGLVGFTSIIYFSSIILTGLFANIIIIEIKKAD